MEMWETDLNVQKPKRETKRLGDEKHTYSGVKTQRFGEETRHYRDLLVGSKAQNLGGDSEKYRLRGETPRYRD